MDIKKLIADTENKNIEFKETLPSNSQKYMKTVVAFANGIGGNIIFGVADNTREIIGIEKDKAFKVVDAITNAIADSCEPAIIPNIYLQTIDEKTLVIVEIEAERQRPYYLKSLGKENGTYVRVAGTTRLADEAMIRELTFEGNNRCFDQVICLGLDITSEDINNLCNSLKAVALKNTPDSLKSTVKDVTEKQLVSWGILIEKDGKFYPTNAYAILTGNEAFPMHIQCGVFKGNNRAIFVDKRELSGPIYEQIEEAYQFVLRNIHLGAKLEGVYRQDVYEIPPESIRELIINAVIHRSYLDRNNIQIAIYDNRLEVTSPGKLAMGQTMDRMKEGYSKIRNEALANAFSYMNLIEHWGSGIPRIINTVLEAGLREPEFIGGDIDLRINIYRGQISNFDPNDPKDGPNDPKDDPNEFDNIENLVLSILKDNPSISRREISIQLNVSDSTIKRTLSRLKKTNLIKREGSTRNGKWIINK
uniref:RNA-binding domain-containing protein n=1 Tax=Thomasclavelia ramosa TaxID=1547 RepID=UPI00402AD238